MGTNYQPVDRSPDEIQRDIALMRRAGFSVVRMGDLSCNTPDKPAISNLWPTAGRKGSDYLATYRQYVTYGGHGYYNGDPISGAFDTICPPVELLPASLARPIDR